VGKRRRGRETSEEGRRGRETSGEGRRGKETSGEGRSGEGLYEKRVPWGCVCVENKLLLTLSQNCKLKGTL